MHSEGPRSDQDFKGGRETAQREGPCAKPANVFKSVGGLLVVTQWIDRQDHNGLDNVAGSRFHDKSLVHP